MQGSPAEVRNAAARRLMARGRFREALDVLNEAIRMDPRFAESFDNRAAVFERLGMYPQADADRRKVAALGGVQRPAAPPTPPAPARRRRVPDPLPPVPPPTVDATPIEAQNVSASEAAVEPRPQAPRYPAAPPRPGSIGAIGRSLATVLISVGLLVAAGVGIYLALNTISEALDDDDGESVSNPGGETPAPTDGAAPSVTLSPDTPEEALEGDPLSFTRFATAWQGVGITATPGAVSTSVTGFSDPAVDVTLSRDGQTMGIAMILYDSADGPESEWNLGEAITPKTGSIPEGAPAWYNRNTIAVVVTPNDALRQEALQAFLDVTP